MVAFNSWILYHYLCFENYLLNIFWLAWKKVLKRNCFLFQRALFFAYQRQFFDQTVCRPDWFTITDSQPGIKFTIGTPVKFPIRTSRHKGIFPVKCCCNCLFFLHFNNNIFSVVAPPALDNDNVTLIQIFRLHTWVLFAIFLFCVEVESNQIHGSLTVLSMKCLPPKIGEYVSLPSYVILDSTS